MQADISYFEKCFMLLEHDDMQPSLLGEDSKYETDTDAVFDFNNI